MENTTEYAGAYGNSDIEIDVLELAKYYLARVKLVLIVMAIGIVLLLGLSFVTDTESYQASSKLLVTSNSIHYADDERAKVTTSGTVVADYTSMLTTEPVLSEVVKNLELDMDAKTLASMVAVSNEVGKSTVEIKVTANDSALARKLANEIADVSVKVIPDYLENVAPCVIEYAAKESSKMAESKLKDVVKGAFLGLILAIIYLTIAFFRDDSIKNARELEQLYGIKVLASIQDVDFYEQRD